MNINYLKQLNNHSGVHIRLVRMEAEMDELWSFVKNKKNQRWLWHAIDHKSGVVLA